MDVADEADHVVFDHGDYAGFAQRLAVILIDGFLLGVAWFAAYGVAWLAGFEAVGDGRLPSSLSALWIAGAWVYLTIVKRSDTGTVAYHLLGLRIVDLQGRRPGLAVMTLRMLTWWLGPVHPIIDYLFMTHGRHRQPFRDRLLGTYVVHRSAVPACGGRRVLARFGFLCLMFLFPEVRPNDPAPA